MASLKTWMGTVVADALAHVQTLLGGVGGVHGMSGWAGDAKALAASQAPGTDTTVARGDHVHPTTGLMLTSHIAYDITGWNTAPVALGLVASPGNATTVSRSDHVHPTTGLMLTTHPANSITGFHPIAWPLADTATGGTSTQVSRGDHQHKMPTLTELGAAAVAGNIQQSFSAYDLTVSAYTGLKHATYTGRVIPWDGRVDIRGNLHVYGLTTGYADVRARDFYSNDVKVASDERLKREIRRIKPDEGLPQICGLAAAGGVIGFRLKTDPVGGPERLGLSAQAVAAAVPLASGTFEADGDEGAYLGWTMTAMIATLVSAVATLDARLTALEARTGDRP